MAEMFRLGGAPMWPTLVLGLLAIAAGVRYAMRPERRFMPLVIALGVSTLLTGALGFVSGFSLALLHLDRLPADERWISMLGLGESLVNVAFAIALAAVTAIAVTVGTWRLARLPAPAR